MASSPALLLHFGTPYILQHFYKNVLHMPFLLTCSVYIMYSYVYAIVGNGINGGDIRLVPGSYLWQGLVEIFLDGVWGTINHVGADYKDARVVCRQLGYHTYSRIVDYGG